MRTKHFILIISILINLVLGAILFYDYYTSRHSKWYLDFCYFEEVNSQIVNKGDSTSVIFFGNSIVANWLNLRREFFAKHGFINRGVGGQTSSQLLLRFQKDVVDLKPRKVILEIGANDIGEGDGEYSQKRVLENVQSMIDIAKANKIEFVICSVLPADKYEPTRFKIIEGVVEKIDLLNIELEKKAKMNNLKYVDFNSKLKNDDGSFEKKYTFDNVHPNEEGYIIMESILLPFLNKFN